jgi:hypothetical protein
MEVTPALYGEATKNKWPSAAARYLLFSPGFHQLFKSHGNSRSAKAMVRIVLSLLVSVGLVGVVSAQSDSKAKKKEKDKPVHGIVQKVDKESGQDGVFLMVEVAAKKKDDSATTTKQEKRFHVLPTTKIEKLSGKKDNITRSDLKLEDLKAGQSVIVTSSSGKVEKVEVLVDRKKK